MRDLVVGTTAQKLLRVSPCPVLVVKRAPHASTTERSWRRRTSPIRRASALRTCLAWLPQADAARGARLRTAVRRAGTLRRRRRRPSLDASGEARGRLEQTLVAFVDAAGVAPGQRVLHVDHGYASTCIEQWIDAIDADLVVMAAHGKSELEDTFLGSVSLAHHRWRRPATCCCCARAGLT